MQSNLPTSALSARTRAATVLTVVHYALLKLHLIGVAAFHKELTEELVIQVIYSFARVIEHNPVYLNRIYELLDGSELATMPYMAVLINN